jgi:hypothetical protein
VRRLYHYLSAVHAMNDIRDRWLKLSNLDDLNDLHEWMGVRLYGQNLRDRVDEWRLEKLVEPYRMACFSRVRDSI